ncbi:CotH kinase family protein [Nannocystis pusilla]|uniref:CotH kinase family protein n=1 Tax=Nannocystis pusilla TaxID=889268 RepID=UPI003DA22E4A
MPTLQSRPFWQRHIPARLRQQALLLGLSVLLLLAVLVLLNTAQLRPIVFTRVVHDDPGISENIPGTVDLFDVSRAHSVSVEISAVEYAKMMDDFRRDGTKTWIRANVTIDGTLLRSVGIRLKGNSTLGGLRGHSLGGRDAETAWSPAQTRVGDAGTQPSSGRGRQGPGGMSSASFDDPATLPLLLSFHKFARGRAYQGRGELAIRPAVGDGANLNEALALQLIRDSGQASQRYTWVQFRFNGSESRTRLVIENPDPSYAEGLGFGPGALFKSTSSNRFTYQGEDQTQYAEDFSQVSAKGSLDLAPVIGLLKFVEQADDATFATQLPRWLDIESFARYVATHELLGNFDDMAGPGRNFLLWYGADERRFRVISWDLNLALLSALGGGPGGRRGPPSGGPAANGVRPPVAEPWAPDRHFPRPRIGNRLKERFLAAPAYEATRARARAELAALWFGSGHAATVARELAARVPRTRSGDEARIQGEWAALQARLETLAAQADGGARGPTPASDRSASG